GYDCIFVCDVARLAASDVRRLETFLRMGGGVVFCPGSRSAENLDNLNAVLYKDGKGILPGRMMQKIQAPPDHHFTLEGQEKDFEVPPLKAFSADEDRISLRTPRFYQYVQTKVPARTLARTVLTFQPETQPLAKVALEKTLPVGDPALIEWNPLLPRSQKVEDKSAPRRPSSRYKGKVLFFTSTLSMEWNTWPGSPSFAAMMQETTRLAVSGQLREQSAPVGAILEEVVPTSRSEE